MDYSAPIHKFQQPVFSNDIKAHNQAYRERLAKFLALESLAEFEEAKKLEIKKSKKWIRPHIDSDEINGQLGFGYPLAPLE